MRPAAIRERAPVEAGHRVALDADEWETVRAALTTGHEWYAAAVAVDGGRVALVCNRWSDGWVLPGGKRDPGESLPAAAEREVREETGLVVTVEQPVACVEQTFAHAGASATGYLAVFAARTEVADMGTDPGATPGEIEVARWFEALPDRVDGLPRDLLERVVAGARAAVEGATR